MSGPFPQVRRLDGPAALRSRLDELGCELPVADQVDPSGPLAIPLQHDGTRLANRFAILPMEGWDGTTDGRPTELVERRWGRFGASGAGLVWGGEAVAVVPSARANPHQLAIGPHSVEDLSRLRGGLLVAHHAAGFTEDPLVGLQLTHSGRWSRPEGAPAPRVGYHHPVLDARLGVTDEAVLSDTELDDLVGSFVAAAVVAQDAGFGFVDVKHCHGYLLHELLSAVDRPGPYGGSFEGRTTFLRRVVEGVRRDAPGLAIGVRLSVFDVVPHRTGADGIGEPEPVDGAYRHAFGGSGDGLGIDLAEPHRFCDLLVELGITMLCVTAGSPYWCPHVQRPAYFPPSDGYLPPRDPLFDVARMQAATRELTTGHPGLVVVGSGLSYLQEFLPNVGQALVADGWMHSVGLGRMALSMPGLPALVLSGQPLDRRHICRTFSDCTTAPRHGLVSGCWPLDDHYRDRPERIELAAIKRKAEQQRGGRRRVAP
jgi:2,4-dienoyl-CoA reductase-like NADH-dependent reductase (Old Yellow Enzyme family)